MLKEEVEKLLGQLTHKNWIESQVEWLKDLRIRETEKSKTKDFFKRRADSLALRLQAHLKGLPAHVIRRDQNFWNSYFWIDVGGVDCIEKNSIVVIGNQLVGLIDEIEERRSKVRLITDTQLFPAVRAVRGDAGSRYLLALMDQILEILKTKRGTFGVSTTEDLAISALENLRASSIKSGVDRYLAKGELCGSRFPFGRGLRSYLKGKGFNYDFPDQEGPAKNLRSKDPLLCPGDLLVTSGLDGVFPEGLEVGIVTKVFPLREGDSTYDLEAISVVSHLNDLREVWVLPSSPSLL